MQTNKNSKILKNSFLILVYAIIFSFILFSLPKYTYAQVKDKDIEIVEVKDDKEEKEAEKEEKAEEKEEEKDEKEEEKDEKVEEKEEEKEEKEEEKEEEKQEKEENKMPHSRMEYFLLGTKLAFFDASKSFDNDGSIFSYRLNFGDGGTDSNVKASHMYGEPGRYWVSLTVIDDGGLKSTTYKNINIKEKEYFYGFENMLNEEQTEESNDRDNYPVITDEGSDDPEKESELALVKYNQFLQGLLKIEKNEITEI